MTDPAVQQMANKLADDCIAAQAEIGDDRMFMELAQVLGAASQTLEEAFLTAVRTRMAEVAGRNFLMKKLDAYRAAQGTGGE
ncbi:hypothetical protein E4Z66_03065 [Aliishimia ponticola]|uniref:Uncharacterized protein n=1 Tax=Aliishimia ponticola TaxID=2499833 RepID=A0A4S4NI54_9RHOB|nr:hypothetical protein [Aliishimia ponticola]THH38565.1 hypothetical protein E4Z66_03065 [Aliishimia ponticola]